MDENYTRDMARLQSDHWWFEGRRRILAGVIARLGLKDNADILEAGCGPGANLAMLSQFGTVRAFEPDEFSVAHAAGISGCDVRQGTLPGGIPFKQSFDLVCAFDVIEHIEDDVTSLKALHDVTAPGGAAVFTVPAFKFLWSHHDEVNHHYRRYTRPMLRAALEKAGYEVTFLSYYNFWLFPLAAGVRLVKKALRLNGEGSDVKMPGSAFINRALCAVFASERALLKYTGLPFGLSVLAVCRRPGAAGGHT